MLEILIIILAFSLLIILHELGHFLVAKKCGVKVEEFGLGLPPRVFGKKIGETLFSLNAIPLGGFVKMHGEEENIKGPRSFSGKSIWQRALIVVAGCAANWFVAIALFSVIFGMGIRMGVNDDHYNNRVTNPVVQISHIDLLDDPNFLPIAPGSPAYNAGLEQGDIIKKLSVSDSEYSITKIGQFQALVENYKGKEVTLTIQRGDEELNKILVPRVDPPEEEGAIGVALTRTAVKSFPWYEAIEKGVSQTVFMTTMIVQVFGQMIESQITGDPLHPAVGDAEVMGPIGIFGFMGDRLELGVVYFLKIIAIISIHLAIINLLPIPALDGGKLVFLLVEGLRGKPVPEKIEQGLTATSFFLLIGLMLFITIMHDIPRLFQ